MLSVWTSDFQLSRTFKCREFFCSPKCWVTAAICLNDQGKVAIACDDSRIYIYEVFSLQPRNIVVVGPLENVPTALSYQPKYYDQKDLLLWGDDGGNTHMLSLTKRFFMENINDETVYQMTQSVLERKEVHEKLGISYKKVSLHTYLNRSVHFSHNLSD